MTTTQITADQLKDQITVGDTVTHIFNYQNFLGGMTEVTRTFVVLEVKYDEATKATVVRGEGCAYDTVDRFEGQTRNEWHLHS